MADYDYKAGKQRLEEILDNDMEVVEQDKLPNDDDFTFTNGYYSWVSAILWICVIRRNYARMKIRRN